jgi:demethylmenaquinone methyltransferase / 2-methoxy-6-polyprenyl-1,4-benzoquinol methylase
MFGEIAAVYDRLDTVMTGGFDRRWRAAAAEAAALSRGDRALDVACGTGKLSALLARCVGRFGEVVGVDVAEPMIEAARRRLAGVEGVSFVRGDALALPFDDGSFDAATIAFGMRNLADFEAGFRELRRAVRPGGRVVCLELTQPAPRWWGRVFLAGFGRAAPILGAMAGVGPTYRYLPASLEGFPDAERMAATMRAAGLAGVHYRRLGLGTVALHVGVVPGDR